MPRGNAGKVRLEELERLVDRSLRDLALSREQLFALRDERERDPVRLKQLQEIVSEREDITQTLRAEARRIRALCEEKSA